MKENIVLRKSKAFALRIIKMYRWLSEEKHEYVLSKQCLRSGTSIGANIRESINAQSKSDFVSKLSIALKESDETQYWLELLHESDYIDDEKLFLSIYDENIELTRQLTSIIKSTKENTPKN